MATRADAAIGPWPAWARSQLAAAVLVAADAPDRGATARRLYREWFYPVLEGLERARPRRPLVGLYRSAHAGSGRRATRDGVQVVERHDVVGADGWWRTWGDRGTPPRTRPGSVRVLFTPRPDQMGELVRTVTATLLPADTAWTLACAADPRRLRRPGAAMLDLPGVEALPLRLLAALAPLLLPTAPPLCLPLAAGAALAGYPGNGMSFGEHRCHLVSLGLRRAAGTGDPLATIAAVFTAHGIDPATPYRAA